MTAHGIPKFNVARSIYQTTGKPVFLGVAYVKVVNPNGFVKALTFDGSGLDATLMNEQMAQS